MNIFQNPLNHDAGSAIHQHFNRNGVMTGWTTHNIFGGNDHHNSQGNLLGHTEKNIFGGHDYHGADGQFLGFSMHHVGDQNFMDSNGHMHSHAPSFHEGHQHTDFGHHGM